MVISVPLICLPWVRRFLEFLANHEAPGGPAAPHLLSLLGNHAHPEKDKGTLTQENTTYLKKQRESEELRLTRGPVTPAAPASPGTP